MKNRYAALIQEHLYQHGVFYIISILYFLSRIYGILFFAPHNDEVLYNQFSQLIHSDWKKYKYISVDGSVYGYYNGPLQYWLTSLTVDWFQNPLLGVRIWALFLGYFGLFFCRLFTRKIWSPVAGDIAAFGILASEHYFYFDSIGLMEVYVYSFGMAYCYFIYKFLTTLHKKFGFHYLFFALAVLCNASMMLGKELGKLYIIVSVFLPFLVLANEHSRKGLIRASTFRRIFFDLAFLGLCQVFSFALYRIVVPFRFEAVRQGSLHSVLSIELFEGSKILFHSLQEWKNQLFYYFGKILFTDYSWGTIAIGLLIPVAAFLLFKEKRRRFYEYLILCTLFVFSFLPFIMAFRSHYPRHWGVGLYFWYILIGCALAVIFERITRKNRLVIASILAALILIFKASGTFADLKKWHQTDYALIETSLGRYNGIGIFEMIAYLRHLPAGILIHDGSWAHPGIDIEIFKKQYPQIRTFPTTRSIMENLEKIIASAKGGEQRFYFVYELQNLAKRDQFFLDIAKDADLCAERKVITKRYKSETVESSGIVICGNAQKK